MKITKQEAIRRKLKTYDGEPCQHGHSGKRFLKGGKCVECTVERTRKFREKAKTGKTGKTAKSKAVAVAAVVPVTLLTDDWQSYAARITATWQQAVENIVATGALLLEAKDKVEHGEFEEMIERELPFGPRAARMLMDIARNPILSDRNHGSVLPPSWRTLYELSKVDDKMLLARIEDHTINPEMERKDVKVIAASVAGTVRRTKVKRREGPTLLEETVALTDEIKDLKAHIDELEAAREIGVYIDTDDDARLAEKILEWIGKERVSRLIAELEKLIPASEAAA